jgi:two-component system chemotaxis sensor kinase CheA
MIRDIAKDVGKEIVLKMSGEETELDRTVIDEIGDPLIHLLRNSADHGIETPSERVKIGKSSIGCINLRAYQDGNNVMIEVEDDGKGINVNNIKNSIIKKGILSPEAANSLTKQEAIDYLFKPSFSTAEKVTDLSGRGVGLDVVRTKIEMLGGVVEVDTEVGKGSKFVVRLPLTLAIIQALLVNIGVEKYAIPLGNIQEIIKVKKEDIKLLKKKEVISLRDILIPIIRLEDALNVQKNENFNPKALTVIVTRKGEKLTGFLVDSLIGQQEVVIKTLGKLLTGIRIIAGATILGDGNVALILDANSLI